MRAARAGSIRPLRRPFRRLERWRVLGRRPGVSPRSQAAGGGIAGVPDPGEGEVLVRTEWLGIDATVRTWLSRAEGYIPPVEIGEVGGSDPPSVGALNYRRSLSFDLRPVVFDSQHSATQALSLCLHQSSG